MHGFQAADKLAREQRQKPTPPKNNKMHRRIQGGKWNVRTLWVRVRNSQIRLFLAIFFSSFITLHPVAWAHTPVVWNPAYAGEMDHPILAST